MKPPIRLRYVFFPLLFLFIVDLVGGFMATPRSGTAQPPLSPTEAEKELSQLKSKNAALKRKLAALPPRELHIVIDTAKNILYLRRGDQTVRETVVSCGSGNVLEDPAGGRTWTFDTPRGVYAVKSKLTDPYWVKPDWAFVEEGEPIPTDNSQRVERGMLGKYALAFGNGFFIHGTLYTRLLGRNVSHGCVRVGEKDLKEIYDTVPIGTKIVIY